MAYTYDCPTRWGDMDAYQHLNNASYVDYLQEARVDFLHSGNFAYMLGDVPIPGTDGPNPNGILVTGHQVEYLHPAEAGQPVRVRLTVDKLGAARFTFAYELFSADRLIARARTVLCSFNLETNQIQRLAPAEREWFATYAEPVEAIRAIPRVRLGDHPAHEYALRVRWSDLDSYRHANNVKYYDYIQEARVAMLHQLAEARPDGSDRPGQWVVVRQDVDYAVQIDFRRQPYQVRTAVQDMGERSVTLAAEILDPPTGTVHATSRTVLVHTTDATAEPLLPWMRDALAPWTLPMAEERR